MNDLKQQIYSERISALTYLIKADYPLIDIGTDHAYLPIALKQKGFQPIIKAVDINEKPLVKAKRNIQEAALQNDNIELILSDGLENINLQGDETIVISGMGGFLISKILERSLHKLKSSNHFILQPNWTWSHLRKWLAANGFPIYKEIIIKDRHKYYSTILTNYTGEIYAISDTEAFIGFNIEVNSSTEQKVKIEYLQRLLRLARQKALSFEHYQVIAENINSLLKQEKEVLNETY